LPVERTGERGYQAGAVCVCTCGDSNGNGYITVNEQLPFAEWFLYKFTALFPRQAPPPPSVTVPPHVLVVPGGFAISMVDDADGSMSVRRRSSSPESHWGWSVLWSSGRTASQFELGLMILSQSV